jgi:preprotein translocase subunit SecB
LRSGEERNQIMNIATNYESPLVLKNIMITEGTFKRSEDSLEDVELQVNVSHNVNQISDREYKIILELSVADPQGKLSVFVKGMAIFETEQKTRTLIERNTLAIMFPYFRSYVSTLTTQPGMMPIVLPAMNIIAMLTEKDK